MTRFLAGDAAAVHDNDYVTTLYHWGHALLRKGDWKISNLKPPFDESDFELFDLANDPGESTNLAKEAPGKLAELVTLWRQERAEPAFVVKVFTGSVVNPVKWNYTQPWSITSTIMWAVC